MPLSKELAELVRAATRSHFGPESENLKPREFFNLCDQTLIHHESPGEREIFVYREGFYRGTCVGFLILTIALLVRSFSRPILIDIFGITTELWRRHVVFAAFVGLLAAFLSFRRYSRFAEHCHRSAFLRFLAFTREGKLSEEKKEH
jgi:hypothetical protein